MKLVPQINISHLALLVGAMLMIAMGVIGPWIDFPLSDPIRGFRLDLQLFDLGLSVFGLFIVTLALTAIAILYGSTAPSLWLLALSIVVLLYIPLYIAFEDTSWIPTYIEDSTIRRDLQRFLTASYLPNKANEPSLLFIREFEWLSDRIRIAWQLLGWGWLVTTIGVLCLVPLIPVNMQKKTPPAQWAMAFAGLPLVVIVLLGYRAAYAEHLYINAINVLKSDDYNQANILLLEVGTIDPVRMRSKAFMNRLIESYFWTHGENLPISRLYLAQQEESKRLQLTSDEARQIMSDTLKMDFGDHPFADDIKSISKRHYAELCINDGLLKYKQGEIESAKVLWEKAMNTYGESWQAVLMSAKAASDVHDYQRCVNYVSGLLSLSSKASITADLYSTMGTCYVGMGLQGKARDAFIKSNEIDPNSNYRALKELGGT